MSQPRGYERGRASELNCSDASQAQIQGSELAHPNIYSISELLVCIKGPNPQIQNYRISMTEGYNRIFRGVSVRSQD